MSEKKPTTLDDVLYAVIFTCVILVLFSFHDSCLNRSRYLDLRDRLERLEQR